MKFGVLIFILTSSSVFASGVTGIINSKGDMVINIIDNPDEKPFDAALLWSGVSGSDATKKIKSANFSLGCAIVVTQPLHQRFGSCRLVLSKNRLAHANGYYGGIVSDPEVLNSMEESNLSIAMGKVLITVDHSQNAVEIKVHEDVLKY